MKPFMPLAAVLLALTACPVVAQDYQSPTRSQTAPPGGSYQGYSNSPQSPEQQQTAQIPGEPRQQGARHPGTLRKFNSNSGYGPEVQFETDRRQQQQQKVR